MSEKLVFMLPIIIKSEAAAGLVYMYHSFSGKFKIFGVEVKNIDALNPEPTDIHIHWNYPRPIYISLAEGFTKAYLSLRRLFPNGYPAEGSFRIGSYCTHRASVSHELRIQIARVLRRHS